MAIPEATTVFGGSAALLFADGRFPSGGHAHSGGVEAAVRAGRISNPATLESFLEGRLATAGLVTAGLAAAACLGVYGWEALDAAADARIPSPALRCASRAQGRQLLRSATRVWGGPRLRSLEAASSAGAHHPVVLGAVAAAAGLGPEASAGIAAYGAIMTAATAAIRLLGLDPVDVHRIVASLAAAVDEVAWRAAAFAARGLTDLPCAGAPQSEIWAEWHAQWEDRLFAS